MNSQKVRQLTALLTSIVVHATCVALLMEPTAPPIPNAEPSARSRKQLIASLFFVQDLSAVRLSDLTSVIIENFPVTLPVPVLPEIDAVAADSFERGDALESAEDVADAERLQGIYVKQIGDRVARALKDSSFREEGTAAECIVHIIQDQGGTVLDVDMEECELQGKSRQRLADAIRAASPLPSPPDGLAMGSYLSIDMSAL